jgi:hypothetical protein
LEIRWSRLVAGLQPELGGAWIKTLRWFAAESGQDRIFEESMFWVVTRALQCGYCMGHCEMLMEVGGLNPTEIAARTKALATGNWEPFSPVEHHRRRCVATDESAGARAVPGRSLVDRTLSVHDEDLRRVSIVAGTRERIP